MICGGEYQMKDKNWKMIGVYAWIVSRIEQKTMPSGFEEEKKMIVEWKPIVSVEIIM